MLSDQLMDLLDEWVARGWLRPLDRAFAAFLKERQPACHRDVLLAAALASHQLGRGHVCLDLHLALAHPDETLSLPPEGEADQHFDDKPAMLLEGLSFNVWEQRLRDSELVGLDEEGNTPLVLAAGRLYLRRYWKYTRLVAAHIMDRLHRKVPVPGNLAARLDRLFGSLRTPGELTKTHIHWQSIAAAITATSAFSVISGGPGTGKTTTVVHLLGLLQELALEQGHQLRIRLAAPTGKAAARLTESIGLAVDQLPEGLKGTIPTEVHTLHRLLGGRPDTRRFVFNAQNPLHVDILVVDEASMIDLEMMAALLEALPAKARLTLLGDKDQLASVEAGSVLGDLCRNADPSGYWLETTAWIQHHTGYCLMSSIDRRSALDQHVVVLQKSHRFDRNSGIRALAHAVNAGDPERVRQVWRKGFDDIVQVAMPTTEDQLFADLVLNGRCDRNGAAKDSPTGLVGYGAYLERILAGVHGNMSEDDWLNTVLKDFNRFQLLSPLRKGHWGVDNLNESVAQVLLKASLIDATEGWYCGRPVMVTRNDYRLGLMNGDTGIVLPVTEGAGSNRKSLKAIFPMADGTLKKIRLSRLTDIETVYAMTVHKSQGSEFNHSVLVLPDYISPILTRELIYTAVTRSRSRFTLVHSRLDVMPEAVKRSVHRASGLSELLR